MVFFLTCPSVIQVKVDQLKTGAVDGLFEGCLPSAERIRGYGEASQTPAVPRHHDDPMSPESAEASRHVVYHSYLEQDAFKTVVAHWRNIKIRRGSFYFLTARTFAQNGIND